jgi:hypothetical protein
MLKKGHFWRHLNETVRVSEKRMLPLIDRQTRAVRDLRLVIPNAAKFLTDICILHLSSEIS